MKLLSVDNYVDFECIGGKCPITCCSGGWGIPVDKESAEFYMSVEGEFGDSLRNGIVKMNGINMFRLDNKTKDCIFLNENKLCRIYRELGPDALCYTCRSYPRSMYQVGDIMFCYLTNSCPEVNRMIMQRTNPLETLFDDENTEMDENEKVKTEVTDWNKFNEAIRAFTTGMHIMQNRSISLGERLFLVLFYVERFQKLVANDTDVSNLIDLFSKPEIYSQFLENMRIDDKEYADKIHIFMIIYRTLIADSYDHPMWKKCIGLTEDIIHKGVTDIDKIGLAFARIRSSGVQMELEQMITYRFFAVFMQGFDNTDYFDKIAYEIIMLVALESYSALTEAIQDRECTQEDRILFYSLCGRIDHTSDKKTRLITELKNDGLYAMERLIKLI